MTKITHRVVKPETFEVDGRHRARVMIVTQVDGDQYVDHAYSDKRFATQDEAFEEAYSLQARLGIQEIIS